MFNQIIKIIFCSFAIFLVGCGDDKKEEVVHTIHIDKKSVDFNYEYNSKEQERQIITVNYSGEVVLIGFSSNENAANWIGFNVIGMNNGIAKIEVFIDTSVQVPPGSYNSTLRLTTGDIDKDNYQSTNLDVSLNVWMLEVGDTNLEFQDITGSKEILTKEFLVLSPLTNWTIENNYNWIDISQELLEDDLFKITALVKMEDVVDSGEITGEIAFIENLTGNKKTVDIKLLVEDQSVFTSTNLVRFTSNDKAEKYHSINVISNSSNSFKWNIETSAPWIKLDKITEDEFTVSLDDNFSDDGTELSDTIKLTGNNEKVYLIDVVYNQSVERAEELKIDGIDINDNQLFVSPRFSRIYAGVKNELITINLNSGKLSDPLSLGGVNSKITKLIMDDSGVSMYVELEDSVIQDDSSVSIVESKHMINLLTNEITLLGESELDYAVSRFIMISGMPYLISEALEIASLDLKRLAWNTEKSFLTPFIFQNSVGNIIAYSSKDANFTEIFGKPNRYSDIKMKMDFIKKIPVTGINQETSFYNLKSSNNSDNIYVFTDIPDIWNKENEEFVPKGGIFDNDNLLKYINVTKGDGDIYFTGFNENTGFSVIGFDGNENSFSFTNLVEINPNIITASQSHNKVIYFNTELKTLYIKEMEKSK
jgi:hypothetical protein